MVAMRRIPDLTDYEVIDTATNWTGVDLIHIGCERVVSTIRTDPDRGAGPRLQELVELAVAHDEECTE